MSQGSIVQPRLLSKINERLVLDAIQVRGPSTRGEVTEQIGVTFATVAKAVSSLLDAKLLEEFDEAAIGRGRPAKRLRLAVSLSQVVGVAIEIEKVTVTAASLDGETRGQPIVFPTPATYRDLIDTIQKAVGRITKGANAPSTLGVGVSVAGHVDQGAGVVVSAVNLPYLTGKNLRDDLADGLQLTCSIARDTQAIAMAEHLRGAAVGLDNFLLVHIGVGIGLGVMIDGRLFFGEHGYPGEIGHMTVIPGGSPCHCGRKGCLETVASERALTTRLSERLGRPVSVADVHALFASSDLETRKEVRRLCKYLALGLSHAMHFFNPAQIVICSSLFKSNPHLLGLLVRRVKKNALPLHFAGCEFVVAETSPVEGSIAHIINHLADSLAPRLSQEAGRL